MAAAGWNFVVGGATIRPKEIISLVSFPARLAESAI